MTNLICIFPPFTTDPHHILSTSTKSCISYILCLIKSRWKGGKKKPGLFSICDCIIFSKMHINSRGTGPGWSLDYTAVPKHHFLKIVMPEHMKGYKERGKEHLQCTISPWTVTHARTQTLPSPHTPLRVWNHLLKHLISV